MLTIFKSRKWAQAALLASGCAALAACGGEVTGTPGTTNDGADAPAEPFVPENVVPVPLAGDSLWSDPVEQDRVLAAPITPADMNDPVAQQVAETVLGLNAPEAKIEAGPENVAQANAALTLGGDFNDCSFQYASAAYMAPDKRPKEVCGNIGVPDASTEYLYVLQSKGILVLAFRGTASFADAIADAKSESKVEHSNPLSGKADTGVFLHSGKKGNVGRGWTARWKEQVAANGGKLKSILEQMVALDSPSMSTHGGAQTGPQQFDVLVVGHSLGAVTAQLAAFDIYQFFDDKFDEFAVRVTAFNPPKLGDSAMTRIYQKALLGASSAHFMSATFSRSGDLVHNVPKGLLHINESFYHPTWNTKAGDKKVGEHGIGTLPYCPQYNKPGFRQPLAAHTLGDWGKDIKDMPAKANCLFGSH